MTANHPTRTTGRLALILSALGALFGLGLLAGGGDAAGADKLPDRLTSRPGPAIAKVRTTPLGEEVQTRAGQRRRLLLPGGGVLYVNQNTTVKLDSARQATVAAGEVFVAAAPSANNHAAFTIKTPARTVTGRGARFAVRAGKQGTGILVTRGQVQVSGLKTAVAAGQQVAADGSEPTSAQRFSHLLAWTRELMAASESPLVPGSPHAGGALVAIDPDGQEARLTLRKYHVDVFIEDGFARTTIDQTYFNHADQRLEGTFYFPLPPDASLSRLAMYVNGTLMEGGMAERDYARNVYERILYQQKDPALLEWVDGSTFKMRVFPLEPRQEKRIILSYTQKLPGLYGQTLYRFPAGHTLQKVQQWSFHALVKNGADRPWSSPSHQWQSAKRSTDLVLDATAQNARFDRDVVLRISEPEQPVHFSSAAQDGRHYLMLRYRPPLSTANQKSKIKNPHHWVVLFESSGDRDPLLARTQIDIVRHLLRQAGAGDTFTVLTAGTRVRSFNKEPLSVTPHNVQAAVAFLEKSHLIGALDLGRALTEAATILKTARDPYLVHVGSGIAAMGERRGNALAMHLPAGAPYVGIGVGRRWDRSFMKLAAERTGGYFTQINPDEPAAWRAFDLFATLHTPRLQNIRVESDTGRIFLPMTTQLAQGEELAAVARFDPDDKRQPTEVKITGTLDGKPFERKLPVKDVTPKADYLPRTWAKLMIDRLLADNPVKYKDMIVALSKEMYVMTPFTSLLVLESEEMYIQFKVDRGRKDHWAMYPCPKKIAVVREGDPRADGRKPGKQVIESIQERPPLDFLLSSISVPKGYEHLFSPKSQAAGMPAYGLQGLQVNSSNHPQTPPNGSVGFNFYNIVRQKEQLDLNALNDIEDSGNQVAGDKQPPPSKGFVSGLTLRASIPEARWKSITGTRRTRGGMDVDGSISGMPGQSLSGGEQKPIVQGFGVNDEQLRTMANAKRLIDTFIYQHASFSGDDRFFYDLVAYAPGMNTFAADIDAVLEAEAIPTRSAKAGVIDDAARRLLDKSRSPGWQTFTVPADGNRPAFTIRFDDKGRYAYERVLPPGIKERVICDGHTLLHLYPDLGIGARRTISRFHRADFNRLVPWALPPAEDLARGADLRLIDEHTIAVVPHGAAGRKDAKGKPRPFYQLHLVFGDNGRLTERQTIHMPAGKIVYREICSADGTIKLVDGKGKAVHVLKGRLAEAREPSLKADTENLVILSLPYRSRDHVVMARRLKDKAYDIMRFADALALFAADFAAGKGDSALEVFKKAFYDRDQRQLGFYVLLAACGQNLDADHVDVMAEHPDEPLAQYLALHSSPLLRKHASQWAVASRQWSAGFLRHLALTHALYQRWQSDKVAKGSPARVQAERDRALDYVRQNKGTVFGWALLGLIEDRAKDDPSLHRELAGAWLLFEHVAGLAYPAHYEYARSLWKSGQKAEARKAFRALYEQTFQAGRLPPIDADFRQALVGDAATADAWNDLLRRTAAKLIDKKQHPAVLALAWQCWQLDDRSLANSLLSTALDDIPAEKDRLPMALAGIRFLSQTGQLAEADQLLQKLLKAPKLAERSDLWRYKAALAEQRDQAPAALAALEMALETEYARLPEVIDLSVVRADYTKLLEHYQRLAEAMVTLQVKPPAAFVPKVVSAADRWRALDRDSTAACRLAGRILQTLGDRDLTWDYLTTPIGLRPSEADPWLDLARTLSRQGDLTLADRAYQAAFEAEPTSAQILWDRAQNLRQAGKSVEAKKLFQQIADGKWQPRFQWLQTQAKWQLP